MLVLAAALAACSGGGGKTTAGPAKTPPSLGARAQISFRLERGTTTELGLLRSRRSSALTKPLRLLSYAWLRHDRLAVLLDQRSRQRVATLDTKDGAQRPVVAAPTSTFFELAAAPGGGGKVVATRSLDHGEHGQLVAIGPGARIAVLARSIDFLVRPALSPDGATVAAIGGEPRSFGPLVLVRKGRVRPLARSKLARDPAWSPDGGSLAFATPRGLAVLSVAAGRVRPLTSGGTRDRRPAWSPDGRLVVYEHSIGDCSVPSPPCNKEIYLVRASGGPSRNLTRTAGRDESDPLWRPRL